MAEQSDPRQSRRALLGAAAGAAAATVVTALARPLPADATTDHVSYLNDENGATVIRARSISGAGSRSGHGIAVYGHSDFHTGVWGSSTTDLGVFGSSDSGTAVYGSSNSNTGVFGYADSTSAIVSGVLGWAKSTAGTGTAGWSTGQRTGILGYSNDGSGNLPPAPANTGVYGAAPLAGGRGGQFSGNAAQLRLVPSSATSHPDAGALGDLFVDKTGRLWFCKKTGTTAATSIWKQVSLV